MYSIVHVKLLTVGLALMISVQSMASDFNYEWRGTTDESFKKTVSKVFSRLNKFILKHRLSESIKPSLIRKVIYFDTKASFDEEILRLADGQMQTIPKTWLAGGDNRTLRAVSWKAYKSIQSAHDFDEYEKLLQHEMAHIYHSELVGDEGMGPIWFFEGFAVVAADQYRNTSAMTLDEMKAVISDTKRGDYREYGFIVRHLMKKYELSYLVKLAKENPKVLKSLLK